MEQLVVLLIFGAIALAKFLVKQAKEQQEKSGPQQQPGASRPRNPVVRQTGNFPGADPDEAERVRKFLEALGIPTDQPKPPPLKQAPPPPPLPVPPRPVSPRPQPVARREEPRREPVRRAKAPVPPSIPVEARQEEDSTPRAGGVEAAVEAMSAASAKQIGAIKIPALAETEIGSGARRKAEGTEVERLRDVRGWLRDASSLRKAVLVREILGAPKGLQV